MSKDEDLYYHDPDAAKEDIEALKATARIIQRDLGRVKTRRHQVAVDIEEILEILEATDYPDLTWVGKNYSKADLIRDLKRIQEE